MTILGKVLHSMTSVLQIPVVIILILFIAAILVAIGWIISEYMNEHKHMQVQLPKLLDEIRAGEQPIEEIIETSGLLKTQKEALIEITKHSDFNDLMMESLAANLLEREQERYDAKLKPTDLLSKLGPMFGLLGTLIPLGPGIIALGQGDTMTLSQSLMTAFDTTIAGLIVAAIAIVISTIRRGWYNNYMSVLETVMDLWKWRKTAMIRKDRRRKNRFADASDINPLNYAGNMADVMLVLAVGIMLALIIHWNVDVSTTGGDASSENGMTLEAPGEQINKDDAVEFDESDIEEKEQPEDMNGGGMNKLGEVYYDAETGKYYVIKNEE